MDLQIKRDQGDIEIYIDGWFLCSVEEAFLNEELRQVLDYNLKENELFIEIKEANENGFRTRNT